MNTDGVTYAHAKKGIILSILAVIAAIPVLSQMDYAYFESTSFPRAHKRFEAGFNDYRVTEPVAPQPLSPSGALFASSPGKNVNAGKEIIYVDAAKNSLQLAENNNDVNMENVEISFKPTSFNYLENSKADPGLAQYPATQLILHAKVLKEYAKKNGFDTSYAFLSNMGMRSNKKRFFVVNLVTMEIEQSGLASHGRGQGPSVFDKQYSNQSGSKCTSLGRYKISSKYKGTYGEAYKMIGLDSSNHNAFSRNIVMHAMGCIPDIDGIMPACVSEGCPAVSTRFLTSLSKIIDSRKKPVLLWIFDSNLEEVVLEEKPAENKPGSDYHTCSVHPLHSNDYPDIQ